VKFLTAWIGRLIKKEKAQGLDKATAPDQEISESSEASAEDRWVTRPLRDLRSCVLPNGSFIKSSADVERFVQSLDALSPLDAEWQHSPCNPQAYIASLENMSLLPGCKVLLDAGGVAHSDEMEMAFRVFSLRPNIWAMELSDGPQLRFKQPPLSPDIIPAGIHLTGEHEANYFHWVCEVLPRLHLYEKMASETDLPLLVSAGLNKNLYDFIDLVCSGKRRVRYLDPGMSHRVAHLVYPSDTSRILDVYDRAPSAESTYLSVPLLKDMVVTIKRSIALRDEGERKRIFVRRCSAYRKLLNDVEVEAFFVGHGFEALDPGELSVRDQIEFFAKADVIVGPSGAALTNILWCRGGTKVFVLHSDHPFKKYPYWDALARVAGADIAYMSGPRAHAVEGVFEVHDDFTIRLDDLNIVIESSRPFCPDSRFSTR
jgi:capsular polysaccharide biosynthesis protein